MPFSEHILRCYHWWPDHHHWHLHQPYFLRAFQQVSNLLSQQALSNHTLLGLDAQDRAERLPCQLRKARQIQDSAQRAHPSSGRKFLPKDNSDGAIWMVRQENRALHLNNRAEGSREGEREMTKGCQNPQRAWTMPERKAMRCLQGI